MRWLPDVRTCSGWRSELLRVHDGTEGGGDLLVLEVLAEVLVLQGLVPVRLLQEQLRVTCFQDLLVPCEPPIPPHQNSVTRSQKQINRYVLAVSPRQLLRLHKGHRITCMSAAFNRSREQWSMVRDNQTVQDRPAEDGQTAKGSKMAMGYGHVPVIQIPGRTLRSLQAPSIAMVSRASSGSDGSHFGSGSLPISTMSGESCTNDPIRHEPASHRRQYTHRLTIVSQRNCGRQWRNWQINPANSLRLLRCSPFWQNEKAWEPSVRRRGTRVSKRDLLSVREPKRVTGGGMDLVLCLPKAAK